MILPQDSVAVRVNGTDSHASLMIVVQVDWSVEEAPRKEPHVHSPHVSWTIMQESLAVVAFFTLLDHILISQCLSLARLERHIVFRFHI